MAERFYVKVPGQVDQGEVPPCGHEPTDGLLWGKDRADAGRGGAFVSNEQPFGKAGNAQFRF